MDIILDLGNKALKHRHWNEIFQFAEDETYHKGHEYRFKDFINFGLLKNKERISEISAIASGEFSINQQLDEIKAAWEITEFIVQEYRDAKKDFILGSIEDVMTQLEDHQVTIGTMLGSKYVNEIRDDVEEWEKKLSYISDVIDEWLTCQRCWMYLESIFSAEDIQK